jgi:RNA polymerase sigma-70 factor (ECF subfamily)
MTQDEDKILIEQIIKNNDQKASNKLYIWYYKEVKSYIKKKFGRLSIDDIEDLSSDAISKSFINLSSFDSSKSSFKTWLYTITENVVINHAKKLENRVDKVHYHYLEDAEERTFDIPSNDNLEDSYSIKQSINYYTSDLDDITNDMIKKKYVEGYSHIEIGEIYALTSSTISNKINYAKNKIKNRIKKGE